MASLPSLFFVLASTCGGAFVHFLIQLYKARTDFYHSKVKKGLPMPKWNPIFGHLLALKVSLDKHKLPPDVQHPDSLVHLCQEYGAESDSLIYLDFWPFVGPLMLVSSPDYAIQACQQTDVANERPADLLWSMHAVTGGPSIFAVNGSEWKDIRSIVSSAFNSNYILSQTGHVVDEAEVYVGILKKRAEEKKMFLFDEDAIKYTMDLSSRVTLNRELHVQQTGNPFASAMRHTVKWHYQSELKSPLIRWSPLIRFIGWWDSYVINKHLSKMLEERYVELRSDRTSNSTNKSVIDLLLSDYMSKQKDQSGPTLDPEFRKWAIPQLRLMFFVGHDSTAATISYTFYLLSKNPWILEKVRQEHDEAFSTDVSEAPRLLREQPHLLNKLTYTTAVIKEVLRLFPPASGFRLGRPEVQLHNNGKSYPTKGTRVWVLHSSLHKNPKYWKEPQSFIPERFLVGPDDPLYPVKGAWRPFEYGPRNCIGQALAMMELRVTLVMTVRLFDVEPAYEEWDRMNNTAQHRVCTFLGERAYQTGNIGAHPADGMPCRISVRN